MHIYDRLWKRSLDPHQCPSGTYVENKTNLAHPGALACFGVCVILVIASVVFTASQCTKDFKGSVWLCVPSSIITSVLIVLGEMLMLGKYVGTYLTSNKPGTDPKPWRELLVNSMMVILGGVGLISVIIFSSKRCWSDWDENGDAQTCANWMMLMQSTLPWSPIALLVVLTWCTHLKKLSDWLYENEIA